MPWHLQVSRPLLCRPWCFTLACLRREPSACAEPSLGLCPTPTALRGEARGPEGLSWQDPHPDGPFRSWGRECRS